MWRKFSAYALLEQEILHTHTKKRRKGQFTLNGGYLSAKTSMPLRVLTEVLSLRGNLAGRLSVSELALSLSESLELSDSSESLTAVGGRATTARSCELMEHTATLM